MDRNTTIHPLPALEERLVMDTELISKPEDLIDLYRHIPRPFASRKRSASHLDHEDVKFLPLINFDHIS